MRFILSLLCITLTSLSIITADDTCKYTNGAATYDFSALQITKESKWQGQNSTDHAWSSYWHCGTTSCDKGLSYNYIFNLCGPLIQKPNVPGGDCNGSPVTDSTNAYQYDVNNPKKCVAISNATGVQSMLLSDTHPSQGFMLRYVSDVKCSSGEFRSLNVHVRCSANLPAEPKLDSDAGAGQFNKMMKQPMSQRRSYRTLSTSSSSLAATVPTCLYPDFEADCNVVVGTIYEPTPCAYHVNIDTVLGCPMSCRGGGSQACSGRGICAEDSSAGGVTRCFCDEGRAGTYCENAADTSSITTRSPNTVLTVFVLILLFAALGLGYALYRKIRGFHGDFDHQYGQLAAKPDQGNLQQQ